MRRMDDMVVLVFVRKEEKDVENLCVLEQRKTEERKGKREQEEGEIKE